VPPKVCDAVPNATDNPSTTRTAPAIISQRPPRTRGYARLPEHGYEPRNTGWVEAVSASTVKRRSPRANAPRHLPLCCDEPSWSGL
jgi:hypothetical protein